MKIVEVDKVYIYPEHVKELEKFGEVIIYKDVPGENEGIERIADAEVVIDNWYSMPASVIENCSDLKFICVAATGYEWVSLDAARKKGIIVSNSPGFSTQSVAEHTIGLMLAAAHKTIDSYKDITHGHWDPAYHKGKDLYGKTLGVIGYGTIGQKVGQMAQKAFGMKVIGITSKSSRGELENCLKMSDFVSINAPLTAKTLNLIGPKEFELMKDGVIVINTGRGAIVNETALIENLKSGKIFAAGLDVYSKEPPEKDSPLFSLPNVVPTGHIAFNTEESLHKLSQIVTENVISFIKGNPKNVIS